MGARVDSSRSNKAAASLIERRVDTASIALSGRCCNFNDSFDERQQLFFPATQLGTKNGGATRPFRRLTKFDSRPTLPIGAHRNSACASQPPYRGRRDTLDGCRPGAGPCGCRFSWPAPTAMVTRRSILLKPSARRAVFAPWLLQYGV